MGSGANAQIGWAIETVPGEFVTPTAFLPLLNESLSIEYAALESEGIIAGALVAKSYQVNGGNITVGGDVQLELYNRGAGKLFRAMFGTVNTTGAGPYSHAYSPGDTDDDTLTMQVGLPPISGSVIPKTIAGAVVSSWEMAGASGEIVTLGLTLAAMFGHIGTRSVSDGVTINADATLTSATAVFTQGDVGKPVTGTGIPAGTRIASFTSATSVEMSKNATAGATGVTIVIGTPLASASYPASLLPYKFKYGTVTVAGSVVGTVGSWTIGGEIPRAEDRYHNAAFRNLPVEAGGLRKYTGTLEVDFESLAHWDRYAAGTDAAVSLVLAIPGTTDTITIAGNFHYQNETPSVSGRDLLTQSIPGMFTATSTDASAMTATIVNADATP